LIVDRMVDLARKLTLTLDQRGGSCTQFKLEPRFLQTA
jgi:hypothetical protein